MSDTNYTVSSDGTRILKFMVITPQEAKNYLDHDCVGNRKISKSHTECLKADMENGKFLLNGNTIVIDVHGNLYDGQHRLTAQIESGKTIEYSVMIFTDEEEAKRCFKTIDTGKKRKVADFYLEEKNRTIFAAVARIAACVENGTAPLAPSIRGRIESARYITNSEIDDFVEQNIEMLREITFLGVKMRGALGKSGAASIYAEFIHLVKFCGTDSLVYEFIDDFCDISPSNRTVSALQKLIIKRHSDKSSHSMLGTYLLGILLDAYYHYCKHDEVVMLNKGEKRIDEYDKILEEVRAKKVIA